MKGLLRIAILLLLPLVSGAQTYYPITHGQGTQTVGVNPINVLPFGGAQAHVGLVCGVGPYKMGENGVKQGFRYEFGYPVKGIRMRVAYMGGGDTVAFSINNNFFPLNSSMVTLGSWPGCSFTDICQVYNGRLGPAPGTTPTSGMSSSKANIDIFPTTPINNVTIEYVGDSSGLNFSLWYAIDPHVYIKEPVTDTLLCAGDSLEIPIIVSDTFNIGNVFQAELSDANGNFSNGTIIGARYSNDGGKLLCGIPQNMPEGAGYRVRVIANMPVDISAANIYPIRITHYPSLTLSSNSPVCDGDTIKLHAATDNATLKWTGPASFTSTDAHPSFSSEMKYNGEYKVTTGNYGCITEAIINVQVKPVPRITSVQNNGPKCETEEIILQAKATDTAAKLAWTGPNGFVANVASPNIPGVRLESAGVYSVIATLNGCTSTSDSTTLVIYPRPPVPVISVNNPVKPGDSIVFHIEGSSDATYQWSGPNGFSTTEQNPIKRLVDVSDEGKYTVVAAKGHCTASNSVDIDVLHAALDYYLVPNPSNGNIRIYGNYLVDKTIPLSIVNSMGQVIYTAQVATSHKFLDINLNFAGSFSNGRYFIRLKLKDEMLKIPFVIGQ